MTDLTIGWEYLTGYAAATDPTSRDQVEWPPHPARVFMALAAAWFETGQDAAEGRALRWLETLDNPRLSFPRIGAENERSAITVYVPVNDKAGPAAATLQSVPAMTRSKQPRTFPRVHVGNHPCFMCWSGAADVNGYHDTLDRLCGKVTRIGHSSSLVRMWVDVDHELGSSHWIADDIHADFHVRRVSKGFLDTLIDNFGEAARQREAELDKQIELLITAKKAITGKGSKDRKIEVNQQMESLKNELGSLVVRPPVRPKIGLWSGYRLTDNDDPDIRVEHTDFDTDLLILTRVAGSELPLASTLTVTQALRGTVMKHSGIQPVPQWISGHQSNGERSERQSGHLAFIPLPFVGHEHADGHLLGVGLVFPRSLDRRVRGEVLGPMLLRSAGEPQDVRLTLGNLGVWVLRKRDWRETRESLQPETWTAHARGATRWASVTPVVLDKYPRNNRVKNRNAWTREVADIVCEACQRIGLPEPTGVDIDTTSWHRGSPRAIAKRRSLRGKFMSNQYTDAPLGDGFPIYPAKGTNAARVQVHVWLEFAEPVIGPVLLGVGRYQGYGVCKPLSAWKESGQ